VKELVVTSVASDRKIDGLHVAPDPAIQSGVDVGANVIPRLGGLNGLGLVPRQDQSLRPLDLTEWNFYGRRVNDTSIIDTGGMPSKYYGLPVASPFADSNAVLGL
jgi:hypothetical protein